MADDDVMIEGVLHGFNFGERRLVPAKVAKQAIADGWAKDPFAAPSDKPAEPLDDDQLAKARAAAAKAATALRGGGETETRAMEADDSADYQTKSAKAKK
jgi:hypothetical protein